MKVIITSVVLLFVNKIECGELNWGIKFFFANSDTKYLGEHIGLHSWHSKATSGTVMV